MTCSNCEGDHLAHTLTVEEIRQRLGALKLRISDQLTMKDLDIIENLARLQAMNLAVTMAEIELTAIRYDDELGGGKW